MHGGTVEAHSEGLGQGSEFIVRLAGRPAPRHGRQRRRRPTRACPAARPRGASWSSTTTATRRAASPGCCAAGATRSRVAHDGPAALDVARGYQPGFVLLDIGLPGMDGYEVARRLRAARIPAAPAGRPHRLRPGVRPADAREAGFDRHLVKPVDIDALQSLLTTR